MSFVFSWCSRKRARTAPQKARNAHHTRARTHLQRGIEPGAAGVQGKVLGLNVNGGVALVAGDARVDDQAPAEQRAVLRSGERVQVGLDGDVLGRRGALQTARSGGTITALCEPQRHSCDHCAGFGTPTTRRTVTVPFLQVGVTTPMAPGGLAPSRGSLNESSSSCAWCARVCAHPAPTERVFATSRRQDLKQRGETGQSTLLEERKCPRQSRGQCAHLGGWLALAGSVNLAAILAPRHHVRLSAHGHLRARWRAPGRRSMPSDRPMVDEALYAVLRRSCASLTSARTLPVAPSCRRT